MSLETIDRPTPQLTADRRGAPASPSDDLALFHRTLSELCRASMPLAQALRLLQVDLRQGKLRQAVGEMARSVESGVSLADAYELHKEHFPELYRALVEAGITSGNLPGVLDEIARHAHERACITERMRRALAYPVVATGFVLVIGLVLVAFVGPQLRDAISSVEAATPTSGKSVFPQWLTAGVGLAVLAFCMIAVLLFTWLRSPLDPGSGLRGIGYRLPLIGRLRLYAAKASFASTMALLARRQLPLPKALSLAAAATGDKAARECVDTMALRAAEGANLSEAVRAGELISPSLMWLVEAAESSGSAASALDDVARIYHQRLERSVDRLCTLATPVAELMLGLVVLGFALTYMLPIVQFADKVYGR